ncbi:MAG: ribonuclease M5 [Anaerovoracaceae bacterium]
MRIDEIIIVEGKDDESAVKAAVSAEVIVTRGYGIAKETWDRIERAYRGPGIIILTDPDYAGEMIRKRIGQRFPKAAHSFISREEGNRDGDIGIENASSESIRNALSKVRRIAEGSREGLFTERDLMMYGLAGDIQARIRRDKLGKALGIGYGNAKKFLQRLNNYGITREEFCLHGQALFTIHHKTDKGKA